MTVNESANRKSAFSEWQLTVLVITSGMCGMYCYPDSFGRWSGITLIISIALTLLSMGMLARCFSIGESKSFPGLLREYLGYIPAKIILAGAALYFAAEICRVTVKQTQMTGLFLLEKTPPQVIPAVTLLTVCFIITSGIRQVSRTAELLFPAIALPLLFILAMGLFSLDFGELLPLLCPDRLPVSTLPEWFSPLGGITAAAYFAGYYEKKRLRRCLLSGSLALAVLCVGVLTCCVGVFSVEGTKHLSFPLTELSRVVSIGNISLNHRFDILYIMIYNAVTLLSAGILLYCCCISLCGVFNVKNHSVFNFLLLPVIYTLSYLSLSDGSIAGLIADWGKVLFLCGVIPAVYIAAMVRRKKKVV